MRTSSNSLIAERFLFLHFKKCGEMFIEHLLLSANGVFARDGKSNAFTQQPRQRTQIQNKSAPRAFGLLHGRKMIENRNPHSTKATEQRKRQCIAMLHAVFASCTK